MSASSPVWLWAAAASLTGISVAVVIPAFEAAPVLDTTLASVVGQTLAPTEIVVVDDGSTDDTAAVAERWSEVAPVRVVRQRNQGPAAARRAGVAATTAPLLAFVDADDVWLADHLDVAVAVHARSGGLVSPDAFSWRPGSALPSATRRRRFPIPAPQRQRTGIVRENFVFSSVVVSRRDYEAAGGFRDGVTGAEDWDLWIRMVRRGTLVRGSDRPTWLYRVGGVSLTDRPDMRATYEEVLRRVLADSDDAGERRAAEEHLGRLQARGQLDRAYAAARSGDPGVARRLARSALHGRPRVAAEALSVAVAPGLATRLGDEARARWTAGRR